MSNQTELEAALFLLRESLEKEKARERRGHTIEKVLERLEEVDERMDKRMEKLERDHKYLKDAVQTSIKEIIGQSFGLERQKKKIKAIHAHMTSANGDVGNDFAEVGEDTSPDLRLSDMKRAAEKTMELEKKWENQEKERRDSMRYWKRKKTDYWITGAIALAVAIITWYLSTIHH